jgi:signal transduction histidine kinase/CheY-like chemotaxis protein
MAQTHPRYRARSSQSTEHDMRELLTGLTAVRNGDFSTRLRQSSDPMMDEIATVFNSMIDQLGHFTSEVTRVSYEIGNEGKLGGTAKLASAAGTWKDLTDSVNAMAGNLTGQVRDISQVAKAVAEGDLSQKITVAAQGELLELKNTMNTMVDQLSSFADEVTRVAREVGTDGRLGGQATVQGVAGTWRDLTDSVNFMAGNLTRQVRNIAQVTTAVAKGDLSQKITFDARGEILELKNTVNTMVDELSAFADEVTRMARTDALLAESQRLAGDLQARSSELQARQDELQRSNADLEDKAAQLARQNRDIELKNEQIERARQEIEERARQLDLASRYKSQFLANMSHELRTPLNSLLVLDSLLAQNVDHNLTPKQVEYATIIHSCGTDLLQLINDILDLAKVEAGKMDIHPERFALTELTDDLYAVFGPLTAEKGLRFAIELEQTTPAEIVSDKQRLRQILHNLLSNAVKFTDKGYVEMSIAATSRCVPDSAGVVFSVSDTGIGIRADHLGTIFTAFQQGDGTTSRRYGGAGLGLAISREVAAQLGGELAVESEYGRGSTFRLYLPLAHADLAHAEKPDEPSHDSSAAVAAGGTGNPITEIGPRSPAYDAIGARAVRASSTRPDASWQPTVCPVPAAARHDSLHGRRVLIVDDDLRNAFALADVLQFHGMTVRRVLDGLKAIQELAAGDIDIVLMDVMMPHLDGYETTRRIRRMSALAHLPIIAVTARAMQGDREKSIAAGANDYVTKPVDIEDLLTRMERALTRLDAN